MKENKKPLVSGAKGAGNRNQRALRVLQEIQEVTSNPCVVEKLTKKDKADVAVPA